MVQLVDRPPIKVGRGKAATTWYAIVPPAGVVRYVCADATRPIAPGNASAERLAAYDPAQDSPSTVRKLTPPEAQPVARRETPAEDLPAEIAAEIATVDAMHRAILADQPIEQWQFGTVPRAIRRF